MSKIQHLKNAPIKEAVIDIRVNISQKFQDDDEPKVKKIFHEYFKDIKKIWAFEGKIEIGDDVKKTPVQETRKTWIGYALISSDGLNVLQIRNNGFTFSRLYPYKNWKSIKANALKYWQLFRSLKDIEAISRVAVRYINKITLPLKVEEISEYFTSPPAIPPKISQTLVNFFTKVSVGYPESNTTANIIQTIHKVDEKKGIDILLDIDVFSSQSDFDEKEMWEFFEYLRDLKNQVFFNSITDKTLEMYK